MSARLVRADKHTQSVRMMFALQEQLMNALGPLIAKGTNSTKQSVELVAQVAFRLHGNPASGPRLVLNVLSVDNVYQCICT